MWRDTRGLRGRWSEFQRHVYFEPAPAVARFVRHFWFVAWDLTGQPPYHQPIVPYPQVHLSFSVEGVWLSGVARRRVVRVLEGSGTVFGVAFRPGLFRAVLGAPVHTLTDRRIDAAEVFTGLPESTSDEQAMRVRVDGFLAAVLGEPDPAGERAAEIVGMAAADPGITRAEQLADAAGVGLRGLQRMFAEHVGVGPKWVIRRYRLHEVTQRLAAGGSIDWAGWAADLGYADQAHFTRDFTALTGETPTGYAQRYPHPG